MALVVPFAAFNVRVSVPERATGVGFGAAGETAHTHIAEFIERYEGGTGANKVGAVFAGRFSSAVAVTHDLRGTLVSVTDPSQVVNFPIVTGLIIRNRSTTSGQYLTVGAGSNPWITWLGASGDAVRVGPGGLLVLVSPVDGYATTEDTGDVLTVTPATGTISYDIAILGRAS